MEPVDSTHEEQEPCEDETTVPTGPWEEDENEDCPEYHTAAFRMYVMKILPCFKRYCHDWTICPFAHPGEKARRRDPRSARYAGIACPEMKKAGSCRRGNSCPYAHTVFEYWLHPGSLSELRASGSRSSTQEALAGSQPNEEELDAAGLGLFASSAVPATNQHSPSHSVRSDASNLGGPATDMLASASVKMGRPASSLSEGSARSLSLSSGSASLSKAAASLSSHSRDGDRVSVSEVNDAVVSLKAAMLEGSADRNQVIDMLSTLLRGGPTTFQGGTSSDTARQGAAMAVAQPATEATHHRTASQPQLGQATSGQPAPPPPPTAHARRHSLAEATPRHRKLRQTDAQSMPSYSAAQRRLPPHVQAAMGTAKQQRKGGSQAAATREALRENPQEASASAGGKVAPQQDDARMRASAQQPSSAAQQLQPLSQASASLHAQGQAGAPARTPERQSLQMGVPSAPAMTADSFAAPALDLAAQARETLLAMGQQQRLPVFPESEDSGELTERMRLLSMAHSQTTEALLRQQHSLQPSQRSASGPSPLPEMQHPFLAAGSGSSSVPLPLSSLQQQQHHQYQQQQQQQQRQSAHFAQPHSAYLSMGAGGLPYGFAGHEHQAASLSEHRPRLEQVSSAPIYHAGMPDLLSGFPLPGGLHDGVAGVHTGLAHGQGTQLLHNWQDAGALREFQASLARSLSHDHSGPFLQGAPPADDPAVAHLLGQLVSPAGLYRRDMQVPHEAEAIMALNASAMGSPSSMHEYGYAAEPGRPHMRQYSHGDGVASPPAGIDQWPRH